MDVVSLVPSVTETLLAWGVQPIGVTRFCEQPSLLAVGGTKDPDVERIIALRPDLVVVNDEENRLEDAAALDAAGVAVHVVSVRGVDDVAPALGALRARLGLPRPSDGPGRADTVPGRAHSAEVRAFVPIWRRPWMTIGPSTYGASLLAAVGVGNVFDDVDDRYPEVTLEDAVRRAPDVVLAPSEPYPFRERHVAELEVVAPVELVDGQDLFWWGVRTPVAVERLRHRLAAALA